jgi:predicted MFS family arabinose efflux permease
MPVLIAARVLSGVGAGAVVPAAYAIVGKAYMENEFGRVFSLMGIAQIAANVAGPIAGGLFSSLGWRWGFTVSATLVVVAAPCVLIGVPGNESPAVKSPNAWNKPDWLGAVLISVSLLSLVLGLQVIKNGSVPVGLLLCCASLLLFVVTYFWEARQRDPILPLAALRTAGMPAKLATAFLIGAVSTAALAFIPLALTGKAGNRSFALLPMMVAAGIGTVVAGLVPRAASKTLGIYTWSGMILSFALLSVGVFFAGALPPALCAIPAGFGMGYLWPALLGRSQRGVASGQLASLGGALQISRNAGGSAAVALLGVLVTTEGSGGTGIALVFCLLGLLAGAGIWTHHRAQLAPVL